MPTPHPHLELARRLLPIAAYVRENILEDEQLARSAVRGLAETLGFDIVVVDPDPEQKLEDLGCVLVQLLRDLLYRPGTRSEALRLGLGVADQVVGVLRGAVGRQGRRWDPQRVRSLRAGGR